MANPPLSLVAWYLPGQTVTFNYQARVGDTATNVGPLTYSVKDRNGVVVASGSLVSGITPLWVYTYVFVMPTTLGRYHVHITNGTTYATRSTIEVVDSHLLQPEIIRQYEPNVADTTKYPYEVVQSTIDTVTEEFRSITGRSFVRRGSRFSASVGYSGSLTLPDRDVTVLTVTVDGAPYTVTQWDWTTRGGMYCLPNLSLATVDYEYGYVDPPSDVLQAAITRTISLLFASTTGIPDRATSYQVAEGGTYALSTPGRAGAETGIPDVDAVLARYKATAIGGIA